jgi:hypothetical protein
MPVYLLKSVMLFCCATLFEKIVAETNRYASKKLNESLP